MSVGPDAVVSEADAALAAEAYSDRLEVLLLESFDSIAVGSCSILSATVGADDAEAAVADAVGSFEESNEDNRMRVESMAPLS